MEKASAAINLLPLCNVVLEPSCRSSANRRSTTKAAAAAQQLTSRQDAKKQGWFEGHLTYFLGKSCLLGKLARLFH